MFILKKNPQSTITQDARSLIKVQNKAVLSLVVKDSITFYRFLYCSQQKFCLPVSVLLKLHSL